MSIFKKIWLVWLLFLGLLSISLFLPRGEITAVGLISDGLQFFLFLTCIYLVIKEPNRKNKPLFLNFALVFSFSIVHHLYHFIGTGGVLFTDQAYAGHYYYQYLDRTAYYVLLSLAIIYGVLDSMFRHSKVYQKYLFALLIVGGFVVWHYHPYFLDPKHLYKTEDIRDWKALDKARTDYMENHSVLPSSGQLAQTVALHAWKDGVPVADLYPDANFKRIEYLLRYLDGDNYLVLLWKPMNLSVINMNVLCLIFLFLFFGYQYKKDPPQGAYVDKIMFLFLLYCSMEALHALGLIKAVDWSTTWIDVFSFGQYITIAILLFMILFFSLRLRFITSVKGEFYEHELVHNAEHITRWRDWVDNLVVHYFLNPKALRGRFLALWTETGKKELAKTAR